jgi:hypothetical protein
VKLGRFGLGPAQHAKEGVKIGCYSGLTCEPFSLLLEYSHKKIAMPVYEIRWPGFVKNTEVHTESDALKYRNEIRKTQATHSPGLRHPAILNISEKRYRAGKEYNVA